MMSHYVTFHVTSLLRAFFIIFQKKIKEKKRKIKSKEKIDKRKIKC